MLIPKHTIEAIMVMAMAKAKMVRTARMETNTDTVMAIIERLVLMERKSTHSIKLMFLSGEETQPMMLITEPGEILNLRKEILTITIEDIINQKMLKKTGTRD